MQTDTRHPEGTGKWGSESKSAGSKIKPVVQYNPCKLKIHTRGAPRELSGRACAFSPGRDPGAPGSGPTSASLHGACFSLCLCLPLSVCLS